MPRFLLIAAFVAVLLSFNNFAYAETLSGGTFVVNGGVTSLSGDAALSGGTFVVDGIVAPIGGTSAGGSFQSNPPLGIPASAPASPAGGNGIPSLFGSNGTPGAPQFLSLTITPGSAKALVSFTTDISSEAQVSFGPPGFPPKLTIRDGAARDHVFILDGLTPQSVYALTITLFSGNITNTSQQIRFSTLGAVVEQNISAHAGPGGVSSGIPTAGGTTGTKAAVGDTGALGGAASGPVTFTGIVQDSSGNFLEDVQVQVSFVAADGTETPVPALIGKVTTDTNGKFTFKAPTGRYKIHFVKSGYRTADSPEIDTRGQSISNTNAILVPRIPGGGEESATTATAPEASCALWTLWIWCYWWIIVLIILLAAIFFLVRRVIHRKQATH